MMRERFVNSRFYQLFNFSEEKAQGRSCMLLSSVISAVINWLTTGLFYTGFLMANGIDVVKIGILTFIPFIANCFSIFSPSILERFQRRKALLAVSRLAYYTLNILAVTVMPLLVTDPTVKMVVFVALIAAANIVNALFTSGYSVWHVNFIPNEVRADYFSTSTLINSTIGMTVALVSGLVADRLTGSTYEYAIMAGLRYFAYALALADVFILTRPREYPYQKTRAIPRLKDIFTIPVANRRFALTMVVVFIWTFFTNVPLSTLNYYLIHEVGMAYTFMYTLNMLYPLFLLLFLPPWKRLLARWG